MINKEYLASKLKKIDKRGWTLKSYKLWGKDKPCPPRLVVNVYKGCQFAHKYCYISGKVHAQEGFRKHLKERIEKAKKIGLEDVVTIVSSSTDPFQPIEQEKKDSLFALDALLSNGFPVLVMTRNPKMLLEDDYKKIINNPKLYVDVSVPSAHEDTKGSIFYSAISNPLEETFGVVKKLSDLGKYVRVKVEPVIPTTDKVQGQTVEEIRNIVRLSKEAGARKVISKTMRLNNSMPKCIYDKLIDYYQLHGEEEKYGNGTNLILKPELRRELLQPVYEACKDYSITFCSCVDTDVFQEKTENCSLRSKNGKD